MSRQLPRLTDAQAPTIRHRPFWTRIAEMVPGWVLMVALWVIVYFVTIFAMKGL